MTSTSALLVLGGTGRTGRRVVQAAIARELRPVAFGRSARPETVPEGARAFSGDAGEPGDLRRALEGVDAVVVALSIPRRSRSPFAPVVGPPDLHSRSTASLLEAMQQQGVRRLIKVSAQGVGDSAARAGWGFRALVAASNLRPAFVDHARADALVQASDLDWTIVRPPVLSDAPAAGPLRSGTDLVTWSTTRVRTGDLAAWILDALDDEGTFGQVLTLAP